MKKILIFAFSVVALLGMIKIATIIPFSRMAADDFGFALTGFEKGIWQAQLYWYFGITGRVTTNFLQTVFGMLSSKTGLTGWYNILTLVLLAGSSFVFFKNLFKSQLGPLLTGLVSVLFLVSYYLITPDKTESWYWLTGSVTYLWPTFLGLGAVGFAISQKQNALTRVLAFFLAFLSGTGNETFGAMFLFALIALLVYLKLTQSKFFKNILFVFIGALISFSIMFLAPGNEHRLAGGGSDEMSLLGTVFYSLQKGPALLFSIIEKNILYITSLLFSLSAFFLIKGIVFDATEDKEKLLGKTFFVFTLPVIMSVVFMLPGYKALGRVPPSRTEVNLSFVVILAVVFAALYISQIISKLNISKYFTYKIAIAVFALLFFFSSTTAFTKTIAEDMYIVKNYSASFDRIFSQLKAKSGSEEIIVVDQLPDSGLIHSQKLNSDPKHWANSYWSVFFGLKGITIEDEKE